MTATSTTVLRATPRDVIAHAWYHLGYRPADSLVLVAVGGSRLRLGPVLRVDLPPPTQPREVLHVVVHRLAAGLQRARATATVALVMSARALKAPPHRLIRSLRDVLAQRRIEVIDVIGVTPRIYRSLICRRERCCPRGGHPVASVAMSDVALAHILSGDVLPDAVDTSAQGADLPNPVHAQQSHASPGAPAAPGRPAPPPPSDPPGAPRSDPGCRHPPVALTPQARAEWWRIWVEALDSGALREAHRSGFAWALADEVLRDAVLATAMGAPPGAFESSTAIAGVPTGLANIPGWQRWLELPPMDDDVRRENAVRVIGSAAMAAQPGRWADALAVLGVLGWYLGRFDEARLFLTCALDDSRHHPLALIVLGLVLLDTPPPWAVTYEDDPGDIRAKPRNQEEPTAPTPGEPPVERSAEPHDGPPGEPPVERPAEPHDAPPGEPPVERPAQPHDAPSGEPPVERSAQPHDAPPGEPPVERSAEPHDAPGGPPRQPPREPSAEVLGAPPVARDPGCDASGSPSVSPPRGSSGQGRREPWGQPHHEPPGEHDRGRQASGGPPVDRLAGSPGQAPREPSGEPHPEPPGERDGGREQSREPSTDGPRGSSGHAPR